jgi:ribosome assembly protein 3
LDKEASPAPAPAPTKKEKKKKSKTGSVPDARPEEDVAMTEAPTSPPLGKTASQASKQAPEDFSAIYLRKIAAEFADDLDKVREAQDFKASSVPMLIHALKQGESLFSVEERKRVVGAAANA